MPRSISLESLLQRVANEIPGRLAAAKVAGGHAVVMVHAVPWEITVEVLGADELPAVAGDQASRPPARAAQTGNDSTAASKLSKVERAAFDAMSPVEVRTLVEIAEAAGYESGEYFEDAVRRLWKLGIAWQAYKGWVRAH
jgi:hypothetical protein